MLAGLDVDHAEVVMAMARRGGRLLTRGKCKTGASKHAYVHGEEAIAWHLFSKTSKKSSRRAELLVPVEVTKRPRSSKSHPQPNWY